MSWFLPYKTKNFTWIVYDASRHFFGCQISRNGDFFCSGRYIQRKLFTDQWQNQGCLSNISIRNSQWITKLTKNLKTYLSPTRRIRTSFRLRSPILTHKTNPFFPLFVLSVAFSKFIYQKWQDLPDSAQKEPKNLAKESKMPKVHISIFFEKNSSKCIIHHLNNTKPS